MINFHYCEIMLCRVCDHAIFRLSICDTKPLSCTICKQVIGEVDYDAEIIRLKCGQYSSPTLHVNDKMPYLILH